MNIQSIINSLKGTATTGKQIDAAFQVADAKHNFNFKFGKTSQYWTKKEWSEVAAAVKENL